MLTLEQWLDRKNPKVKKAYRIPKVTKKRAAKNREYAKRCIAYLLLHPYCQIYLKFHNLNEAQVIKDNGHAIVLSNLGQKYTLLVPLSNQVHHAAKPKCKYLNDESTWFAASPEGHEWVENNKKEARRLGLLQNI